MDIAVDLLSQFTGTGGGAKHALVNFGVAAIFWALLLVMSKVAPGHRGDPLAGPLAIGFALALSREVLMLGVKTVDAYGTLSPETLHLFFPPLEHALSNIGLALIAAVFAARFTGETSRWLRFGRISVGALVAVYLATAIWWAQFSWRNPEVRFGQTWCDWAFRITTSLILGIVVVTLLRASRERIARIVTLAFTMFFANEFLKIIDMALGEQYESTFATIRHALFLAALPLLAYVYIKDQAQQLDDLLHSLEQRVDDRTEELADAVAQLEDANVDLVKLSSTDPLTDVGNRAALDEQLETEWVRGTRAQTPLSVLIFDVDNFKTINDELGHVEGDEALRSTAAALREHVRDRHDFVGRYGGDEFIMLLPNTAGPDAERLADRIRSAVADLDGSRLTLSIGVATTIPRQLGEPNELIVQADQALYRAKQTGRNRVVSSATADA